MSCPIAVDMIESQELKGGLTATRAYTTVGIKNGLLERATLRFALRADFLLVGAAILTAGLPMPLSILRLPSARLGLILLAIGLSIGFLIGEVLLMLFCLAGHHPCYNSLSVRQIPIVLSFSGLLISKHNHLQGDYTMKTIGGQTSLPEGWH